MQNAYKAIERVRMNYMNGDNENLKFVMQAAEKGTGFGGVGQT